MFFLTKVIRKLKRKRALLKISDKLRFFVKNNDLPVIIVSYNNHTYVDSMIKQLNNFNIKPVVIDNHSTSQETIDYLRQLNHENAFVIFSEMNLGHRVGFLSPVYDVLPNFFGYTDPDLIFKKEMPITFIEDFKNLTEKYQIYKVGCALELSGGIRKDTNMKINTTKKPFFIPSRKFSIQEWESRYWKLKIDDDSFDLYSAPIDTTFAIYNKKNYFFNTCEALRVAGDYAVFHLPWYKDMDLMSEDQLKEYHKNNNSNTWKNDHYI